MNKKIVVWIVCILIMASVAYSALEKIGVGEITRVIIALAITISSCIMITVIAASDTKNDENDEQ